MKRTILWVSVALGVLGVVLCAAGLLAVVVYYPVAKQKSEDVYAELDAALLTAEQRLERVQGRVVIVNNLTADFRASLTEWLTSEQLDQQHIGHRAELIAARLHHTRDGLDFLLAFLQKIRSAQRLSHPLRQSSETPQIDGLLAEIGTLHDSMSSVVESVETLRLHAEAAGDEEQLEASIEQAIADAIHAMEVIDSADERLLHLLHQVRDAREKADQLELRIQRDLWWGRLGAFVVLPWMAAGQLVLCVIAWGRARQ